MKKRASLSLLALLLVVVATPGVGATTPSETAAEPAPPAAAAELTPAPACAEEAHTEASTAEADLAPSPVELADLVVETGWYYGICVPNFCQQCTSDYECTAGNTCRFDVQCP